MKKYSLILAAVLFVLASLGNTVNALMRKLSLEELTRGADYIVVGQVRHILSRWNPEGTMIYTFVDIQVADVIKGGLDAEKITVRVDGSQVDSLGVWVEDQPDFEMGEVMLLFLNPIDEGFFKVYGLFQGKYTLENGQVSNPIKEIPLEAFVAEITRIVNSQGITGIELSTWGKIKELFR